MADGPAGFIRGFPCPALLRIRLQGRTLSATGLLPSLVGLSKPLAYCSSSKKTSYNPEEHALRFGLFRVRSPLLTESRLISLPRGTEMVHFPRFASSTLCIQVVITRHDSGGVAPFRNPRIKACLPLPEAYRCLPRLSSPLCAKASTVNP